MNVADFDYELPEELIAQKPCDRRDGSRLLVVDRKTGTIKHEHFYDIEKYLRPDDCLVLNDSKVIPARLFGTKDITGAKIEFLLTKRIDGDIWETMVRPGKRLKPGDKVIFEDDFTAEILENGEDGTRIVRFDYEGIFMQRLEQMMGSLMLMLGDAISILALSTFSPSAYLPSFISSKSLRFSSTDLFL